MPIRKMGLGRVISASTRLIRFTSPEAVSAVLRIPSHHAAGAAYTLLPNSRVQVERVIRDERSPSAVLWIRATWPNARIDSSSRVYEEGRGLVERVTFDVPEED